VAKKGLKGRDILRIDVKKEIRAKYNEEVFGSKAHTTVRTKIEKIWKNRQKNTRTQGTNEKGSKQLESYQGV
jgi:hypothetical protein